MSQATDISSATHVADFWRCGLLLPHSPISLLCWSHDTWRRSRMLHPTQPIHDARKLHEQSMQWNPQCPCETMPRSWAIHWYMIAVHSILWLTTLGQSNREEFLMVEFGIKLKSCHVCLKQKWWKKKDVLFFLFGFQSERRRSKVCTSSTFLLPLCFGNMEHHDHHHAAAALNSQSIQLWSNLVIHNPKCGNCK